MSDPMSYTMEQLVKALVDQTIGEANFDESYQVDGANSPTPPAEEMAENLYHLLKGLRTDSEQAREVLARLGPELDRFSHYPAVNNLLDAIEQVVRNKYNDDPQPVVELVTKALGSPAASDWYNNSRKYR